MAPTPDPACVADWDSVSYTSTTPHCLRRVDTNLHYPEDLNGRVHHDGQIWSGALWDIRNALGNTKADRIILEAQFGLPDPTMPDLAQNTVDTAQSLYGRAAASAVLASVPDPRNSLARRRLGVYGVSSDPRGALSPSARQLRASARQHQAALAGLGQALDGYVRLAVRKGATGSARGDGWAPTRRRE